MDGEEIGKHPLMARLLKVGVVSNFFAAMYKDGYLSSSINNFWSTILSVHDKVDGRRLGSILWW